MMPPKKRNCAPALSVRHLSESQDDDIELHDESSDSEFDDDPVIVFGCERFLQFL
jgi:hypothetical protein